MFVCKLTICSAARFDENPLGRNAWCFFMFSNFLIDSIKTTPFDWKNHIQSFVIGKSNVLKCFEITYIQFWIIFYNLLKQFLYLAWISCISSPSEFYGSNSIFNSALCILNVLICFQNGVQVACSPHVHDESPTIGFNNTNDCIC